MLSFAGATAPPEPCEWQGREDGLGKQNNQRFDERSSICGRKTSHHREEQADSLTICRWGRLF